MDNVKNGYLESNSFLLDYECKYNCREKFYVDVNGEVHHLQTMYARRFIFNPDGMETVNGQRLSDLQEWERNLDEMYGHSGNVKALLEHSESGAERSKRRAKSKLTDIILCNNFDCFCTLTLNPKLIDNKDYNAVIKKLNTFLDNRVRRNGLIYVGVPELHKKGGLHFHFLCNSESLKLVDSGTVSCKGIKKPIKVATADRYGIPDSERQTVYNISDWSLGFTTAIKTYGDVGAIANYVGKYITKNADKIGGRWYYSGGKLNKPFYKYSVVSFDDVKDFDYEFNCGGGDFKVVDYGTGNNYK